jgi:uncharacterized membrane protein YozB (DUF420 family)
VSLAGLPTLDALLNATSAALVTAGWVLIRRGHRGAHRACMLAAIASSAVFLVCYLVYHYHHGSTRFEGPGAVRAVYLAILLSHTVLAAAVPPLVLVTATRALRGRFDRHRAIALYTLPVWLWVSVSGVVVYWMLYRL